MKFFVCAVCFYLSAGQVLAQDDVTSRRVDALGGTEVVLNQVDTSAYPKVTIFATVLKDGSPVAGLKSNDFRVREDEVDQEPLTVEPKLTNLNSVITVDTSGSIRKALPKVKAAAKQMISSLEEGDKLSVISFARQVKTISSQGSKAKAAAAIDSIIARGDTALYDAAYESVEALKDTTGRKVVVLITDGVDDNGAGGQLSERSVSEAVALAKTVNVPIYTIGLGQEKDEGVLKTFASESGGKYFDAATVEELAGIYETIGKQLEGQYSISYSSNLPSDGSVRRLTLSHAEMRSSKEYTAPAISVAKSTASTIERKPIESKNVKYSFPDGAGVHVVAVTHEDGEPIEVNSFEILKVAESNFDKDQSIKTHYRKKAASFSVDSGTYRVVASLGKVKQSEEVEVDASTANNVVINLNAGSLRVNAVPAEGEKPVELNAIEISTPGTAFDKPERVSTVYGKTVGEFILSAGKYVVEVKKGKSIAKGEVEVVAGEQVDTSLVLSAGVLKVAGSMKEGTETVELSSVKVTTPKTAFDDSKRIAVCYNKDFCSFTLDAGEYQVTASKGASETSKMISVKANEVVEVVLSLDAGVVNIANTAEGRPEKTKSIKIYSKPASAVAKRELMKTCYNDAKCSESLPAGDYIYEVAKGEQVASVDFSIQAGQVLNIEVTQN